MRVLNSFIAFRTFYGRIFADDYEQKHASAMLSAMWEEERNRPFWAIIASAYSVIRDFQGKDRSPLKHFLDMTAVTFGLPGPNDYLDEYGWGFGFNEEGTRIFHRVKDPSSSILIVSGINIFDIISFCVDCEYVDESIEEELDINSLLSLFRPGGEQNTNCQTENNIMIDKKTGSNIMEGFWVTPAMQVYAATHLTSEIICGTTFSQLANIISGLLQPLDIDNTPFIAPGEIDVAHADNENAHNNGNSLAIAAMGQVSNVAAASFGSN